MQLADALQFLHSISIFHRDLKPENVLITSQRGEPPTVAIADFGLSSDAPMSSIELGSIHYMSPGVCTAAGPTLLSDFWLIDQHNSQNASADTASTTPSTAALLQTFGRLES